MPALSKYALSQSTDATIYIDLVYTKRTLPGAMQTERIMNRPPQPRCPMFGDDCRFCSHEKMLVPYAPLINNPKTGRLEPGMVQMRSEPLGEFCNNVCGWVSTLKYCPARWALRGVATSGVVADGCGVYPRNPINCGCNSVEEGIT